MQMEFFYSMDLFDHFLVQSFLLLFFSKSLFLDSSTQQFIRDLLDGFFPSELQKRFPDGVPFNVLQEKTFSSE
jgi:hypothetical protein